MDDKNQRIFELKNLAERERPHLLLRDPDDRGDTAMPKSAVYKIFIWVFDFYLLCQIQKIQQCWSLQISPIVIWYLSHRLYQIQKLLQCQILQYLKVNIFTSVNNNQLICNVRNKFIICWKLVKAVKQCPERFRRKFANNKKDDICALGNT